MKNLLFKILNKKRFKAEVHISEDDFTAELYTNSLSEAIKWTIVGLTESYATSNNKKSVTRGIHGKISKLSLVQFDKSSLKLFEYKQPKTVDYLYMTDAMLYVPESILRELKKENIPVEYMFK